MYIDRDLMYSSRMALHIIDPAAEAAVRKLAKLRGITLTRAVRQAATEAVERAEASDEGKEAPSFEEIWADIQEIQKRIAAYPRRKDAIESHKTFFDWINEEK
jgi:antitoxin VapB